MKSLVTGLERLGLDTQSLRDFITAQRSGQILDDQYKHILVTLQLQVTKALDGATEPAAVKLILSRLDKKLQHDLAGSPIPVEKQVTLTETELQNLLKSVTQTVVTPSPVPPQPTESPALSEEILHQLRMMNEEVKGLKDSRFHTISPIEGNSSGSEGPDAVFVNPMDQMKAEELESNITIEEKASKRNLKDKIKRLKELKRGKEED